MSNPISDPGLAKLRHEHSVAAKVLERLRSEAPRAVHRAEFAAEHGGAKAGGAIRWLAHRGYAQADDSWVEIGPKVPA